MLNEGLLKKSISDTMFVMYENTIYSNYILQKYTLMTSEINDKLYRYYQCYCYIKNSNDEKLNMSRLLVGYLTVSQDDVMRMYRENYINRIIEL